MLPLPATKAKLTLGAPGCRRSTPSSRTRETRASLDVRAPDLPAIRGVNASKRAVLPPRGVHSSLVTPMRAALLCLMLVTASRALGQTVTPGPPLRPAESVSVFDDNAAGEDRALRTDLERIRRALARPDTLRAMIGEDGRVVFRVEVEGQLPRFADFIGRNESLVGPSPWGSMTHGDFLQLVTPPQAQSFGAFTNGDLLQVLATSLASAFVLNGAGKAAGALRGCDQRTAQPRRRGRSAAGDRGGGAPEAGGREEGRRRSGRQEGGGRRASKEARRA